MAILLHIFYFGIIMFYIMDLLGLLFSYYYPYGGPFWAQGQDHGPLWAQGQDHGPLWAQGLDHGPVGPMGQDYS